MLCSLLAGESPTLQPPSQTLSLSLSLTHASLGGSHNELQFCFLAFCPKSCFCGTHCEDVLLLAVLALEGGFSQNPHPGFPAEAAPSPVPRHHAVKKCHSLDPSGVPWCSLCMSVPLCPRRLAPALSSPSYSSSPSLVSRFLLKLLVCWL